MTAPSWGDPPATYWGLVAERAGTDPDRVVLADDLGRSLTFADLAREAEVAAAGLAAMGVGPGTRVSWQLPTCLEAAVLTVALARIGAVQNPLIAVLRHREIGIILGQVQPAVVLVPGVWRGHDHTAMVRELAPDVTLVEVDHRGAADQGVMGLPVGDPSTLPPPPADGDEVRWVYYSSGTTAAPKGIRHADRSVVAACVGMLHGLEMGPADVYPIAFPLPHIGGAVMMAMALRSASRLVLFDAFDARETPLVMAATDPTLLGSALPFHLAYLDAQHHHGPEPLYPRLKACTSGGAAKPAGMHARIRDELGGRGIVSSWGLTEAPLVTHGTLADTDEQLDESEGRPSPGVEVRVVDLDGRVCGPDEVGELRLKAPQMFAGYLDPALDAAAFDEDGWFRTGDLGVVRPSGHVVITGRLKDVIVRNAENISAKEVEDVLLTHPALAEVAVLGLPDERTGERVCAVVTLAAGAGAPTLADLADHCRTAGLARFKTPEQVEVVDAIPRSSMGKVLVAELRSRLA